MSGFERRARGTAAGAVGSWWHRRQHHDQCLLAVRDEEHLGGELFACLGCRPPAPPGAVVHRAAS